MKSVKRLIPVLVALWLLLGTVTTHAASYYVYYSELHGTQCGSTTDPSWGPFYAYFDVAITSNLPTGSRLHTTTYVNGVQTVNTWTVAPAAFTGTTHMDRIDSNTSNFTGKKVLDLWFNGTLRSHSVIVAKCAKSFIGQGFGPHGAITDVEIY